MDIKALYKEGHSIKAIARMCGRNRNTVRRVLREAGPTGFRSPERESCLDSFKAYVKERFEACGLSGVRLLTEIQPMGYTGSLHPDRTTVQDAGTEYERFVYESSSARS